MIACNPVYPVSENIADASYRRISNHSASGGVRLQYRYTLPLVTRRQHQHVALCEQSALGLSGNDTLVSYPARIFGHQPVELLSYRLALNGPGKGERVTLFRQSERLEQLKYTLGLH